MTSEANVSYDSELVGQFFLNHWVSVTVKIKDNTNISISNANSTEFRSNLDKRTEELTKISDSIISTISKEEFQLEGKFPLRNGFYGNITKKGFDKLLNDTRINKIYADKEIHSAGVILLLNIFPYLSVFVLTIVGIIIFIKIKKKNDK